MRGCNNCMVCMLCRSLDYGLMFRRVYVQLYGALHSAIYRFPNNTTVGLFYILGICTVYLHMYVCISAYNWTQYCHWFPLIILNFWSVKCVVCVHVHIRW